MSDGIEIRTNLPDFRAELQKLGFRMERNIVGSAANAAGQAFKKAVKKEAPILQKPHKGRDAGTLRRALYVYRRRNPVAGTVEYSVSWRKGKKEQRVAVKRKGGIVIVNRDAFYGYWLEHGWVPRGRGKALWRTVSGRERSSARLREREAGATVIRRQFLVPGFNAGRQAALDAFNAKMRQRLDQEQQRK